MDSSFLEEMILNILRQANTSLTILEIAERTGIHRVTASKYLASLEAKGHVSRRNVGKAKLYSPAGVQILNGNGLNNANNGVWK
jgi:predicted transcriptional regulator